MNTEEAQLAVDVIEGAADRLEKDGWWQIGDRQYQRKQTCALLAITSMYNKLTNKSVYFHEIDFIADKLIVDLPKKYIEVEPTSTIINWNDGSDTTLQKILDHYRKVAKNIRIEYDL